MTYYYKLNEEYSKNVIEALNKMQDYDAMIIEWLKKHFEISEEFSFIQFIDIPEFTFDILQANDNLKNLVNKTNNRLNQRNKEAKVLIDDWKTFKQDQGYGIREFHGKANYAMRIRSIFLRGSVKPLIDRKNNIVYVATSEQANSKNISEIGLKEFNLKEIELSEDE